MSRAHLPQRQTDRSGSGGLSGGANGLDCGATEIAQRPDGSDGDCVRSGWCVAHSRCALPAQPGATGALESGLRDEAALAVYALGVRVGSQLPEATPELGYCSACLGSVLFHLGVYDPALQHLQQVARALLLVQQRTPRS